MYHKPRMCRTCLQMSRGDFKFVSLDCVDPLWESNSPNLKEQLMYIVPELKLDSSEAYICTSCFIALRTAYEFKRMCQVTEQKFQSYNYKYRRPFGVGPGSPQFHVSLNDNSPSAPNFRCQNLNYLQSDTSIDITEHHLYDASKVLPRKQITYLNNVSQKLPEIDVEVIMNQTNGEKQTNADKQLGGEKQIDEEKKANSEKQKSSEKLVSNENVESDKKIESKDQNVKMEKKEEFQKDKMDIKDEKTGLNKMNLEKIDKIDKIDGFVDKKIVKIEKREENVEKKYIKTEDSAQDIKENALPKDLKLDLKSGNITFPNLPGIEIVPRKLDSSAIRRKYNIGSQISILKTPKSALAIDAVVRKACEEIDYLKTNNILPEALNCAVRLEYLTSWTTIKNTKEKYSLNEIKAVANAYYSECSDELLICKYCGRYFSTAYWLEVHEEEHMLQNMSEQQLNCSKCSVSFKNSEGLQEHLKQHSTDTTGLGPVPSINSISRIAVPLLGNNQISLTPIPRKKYKEYTGPKVIKIKEEVDDEISSFTIKEEERKFKFSNPAIQDGISTKDFDSKELLIVKRISDVNEKRRPINKSQRFWSFDNNESLSSASSPLPSPGTHLNSPSDEEYDYGEDSESKNKKLLNADLLTEQLPMSIEDMEKIKKQRKKIRLLKKRFKSLFKKKVKLTDYSRCFICFKMFKTKFSFTQHRKYIHVPNTCDDNYWLNFIKAQKIEKLAIKVEPEVAKIVESHSRKEVKETYFTPVRTAKSNRAATYACNICDKRLTEQRFLELHMYVHTPTFVCMDPNVLYNKNGDVFRCYLCEKVFPKERYLKLHNLQVHLTKTIVCKICNREFRSDFWYSQHKCVVPTEVPEIEEPVEDENNQFPCTVCNRKFARLRFMKSHRHRMHKDVLEDGSPKKIIKQESVAVVKDDVYDSDDSNFESENDFDIRDADIKELDSGNLLSFSDRSVGINDVSSRRSLSRGVPKIQCDFCGDYIEETVYDKHIFEHNKLRLDKSLSKRKSLDSTISDTSEKKQSFLKCPVCSKPFKRKYNLSVHISKYHEGAEGFDLPIQAPELNETVEEEEKYLSDSESSQKEPPEIVYGQISLIEGIELYECCERTFRLKAHFYRHFKIKHPNCIFKPIYVEQKPVMDSKNVHGHLVTVKQEVHENDLQKETDKSVSATNMEESMEMSEQKFNPEEDTSLLNEESEQKDMHKRGRRRKINPLTEEYIDFEEKTFESENVNKRKLAAEFISLNDAGLLKRQKLLKGISDDKSITITSEDSEDMEATAHHLRQLDLLPVANKNTVGRYECHICEKRFKQKCQLRDHFNVHTGDKPYKCNFCNPVRGFTQTSSLYVHFRRVHAVVMQNCIWEVYSKNGSCTICLAVFDKHSQMFEHMKDHYMKTAFECRECHNSFNMSCHYKLHDMDVEEMHQIHLLENFDVEEDDDVEEGEVSDIDQDAMLESMLIPDIEVRVDSDTDSSIVTDKFSGCDENKPSKCTKCDKTFVNKQQLRFHKKSLAHIQQIQAIRSRTSEISSDEMEEDSIKTDSEAIADIENGVKAMINKIRTFKKYHCNICGASFIKRIHLKKHKRRHKIQRTYLKSHKEGNVTDPDETQTEIDVKDTYVDTNVVDSNLIDSNSCSQTTETETETVLEVTPSNTEVNPSIEMQLADKVPADTEIISLTAGKPVEETDDLNLRETPQEFVDISELSEKKFDGDSTTNDFGSFDVILKIAESTSDLNKQYLFKHTNSNRGVNFDMPNADLNLKEDLSTQNAVIELPESTITYINPNHNDISLITTGDTVNNEDESKDDAPELDFTIEVSKGLDLAAVSTDNNRSESKKTYEFNVEDITLEINEPSESSLDKDKGDDKSFYSNLSNDLIILPISEDSLANTSNMLENSSPLNDLSFHIVGPSSEDPSDLTTVETKTLDSAQNELSPLDMHEAESTFTIETPSSVSDKCLELGE